MIEYVLGFAFSLDVSQFVGIHKLRGPREVVGRINGIGGKVEPSERPLDAMRREFAEETGVFYYPWDYFGSMGSTSWRCRLYTTRLADPWWSAVRTMTDEPIVLVPSHHLDPNVVPNLLALVPLALSFRDFQDVTIRYRAA